MKLLVPSLLALAVLAGCGGSNSTLPLGGDRTPGYYTVNAQLLRQANTSLNFTGRVSISQDGTVRLFGLSGNGSRVTLVSGANQANGDGTNTNARLDNVASTGDLTAFVSNLVAFNGTAFSLIADGTITSLPTLGTGTTLTAGTYRGELVRVGSDNSVTDWGTVTATLTITTPGPGEPVRTLTANLLSASNGASTVQAQLNENGTATSAAANLAVWTSNGSAFTLKLSENTPGNAGLYLVLNRQAPAN